MIHGLDTGFLVAVEVVEHADHTTARRILAQLVATGHRVALAPQVLAECIHVVTDPQRFAQPLSMDEARHITQQWWTVREVDCVFRHAAATQQFFTWLGQCSLVRKRKWLLDTMLVVTSHQAGIHAVLTTNPADFATFGLFTCITPSTRALPP